MNGEVFNKIDRRIERYQMLGKYFGTDLGQILNRDVPLRAFRLHLCVCSML